MRSEDLPAPCIAIHTQSSENFNKSFTDVFRAVVSIRYDEHYADSSSQIVQENFDLILNAFLGDDLTRDLGGSGYKMFRASIDGTNTEIINDILSNEILLELIYERETN